MVGHNGHCLGKVRTGMSAEGRMHYDETGNENNSNKSAGDALGSANTQNGGRVSAALMAAYRLPRPDPRNLRIGHNWIWIKSDIVDSKFGMIKDHLSGLRTFSKYPIVILTREEQGKNWPNQLRKGIWFTDGVCNQQGTGAGICRCQRKYNGTFHWDRMLQLYRQRLRQYWTVWLVAKERDWWRCRPQSALMAKWELQL